MIEKIYNFTKTDSKVVERLIEDDNVGINHMVLRKGELLPEHFSNSHVYVVVVRGAVSLKLGEQDEHRCPAGSIVNVPYNIKMNVSNKDDEVLEFFVVKAPSPKNFKP